MTPIKIDLTTLVTPPHTDFISGRSLGEKQAAKYAVVEHLMRMEPILLCIDDTYVKAINDSFIKGFFSDIFKKLKTKEKVQSLVEIEANEHFKKLFDKNWTILEALYGSKGSNG